MRWSRLSGDVSGVLKGSGPRQLTVQVAPCFDFCARDRRVCACIRFSRGHRQMIAKDGERADGIRADQPRAPTGARRWMPENTSARLRLLGTYEIEQLVQLRERFAHRVRR